MSCPTKTYAIGDFASQTEINWDHNSLIDFSPNSAFSITAEIMRTGNDNGFFILTKGQDSSNSNHYIFGFEQAGEYFFQIHNNGQQGNRLGIMSTDDFRTYNGSVLKCLAMYDGSALQSGITLRIFDSDSSEISFTGSDNSAGTYTSMGTQQLIAQSLYLNYNSQYSTGRLLSLNVHNKELTAGEITAWLGGGLTGSEVWPPYQFGGIPGGGSARNISYG